MEIITVRRHHASGEHAAAPESRDIYGNSPDREYMEMCAKVDHNPPATWEKYDTESPVGIKKIIEMEYKELMAATTEKDTVENIYHLSVALLRLWRMHNAKHGNTAGS